MVDLFRPKGKSNDPSRIRPSIFLLERSGLLCTVAWSGFRFFSSDNYGL